MLAEDWQATNCARYFKGLHARRKKTLLHFLVETRIHLAGYESHNGKICKGLILRLDSPFSFKIWQLFRF